MLTPSWMLTSRLDVFVLEIDDLAGELYSGEVGLIYIIGEKTRWGLGAGYKFYSLEMSFDRSDWNGGAKVAYHGPKFFASVMW